MTLNFTLIVQGINFIIAYFLIRSLFLKPAIAQLSLKEEIDAQIIKELNNAQAESKKESNYLNLSWKKAQERFRKNCPNLKKVPSFLKIEPLKEPVFSKEDTESTIILVKNFLEKRLFDVS